MASPHNRVMHDSTDSDLLELARLYLDDEQAFVVRRCVQRFEAGKISAREAVQRIRRCPVALDGADLTHSTLVGADLEGTNRCLPHE